MSVAAQFEAHASEDLSSPFYFNASHWRAMDGIVEGVKAREGIMVMTGPTGSGKTMLMRAISDNLGEGASPLFLQYASLNFREFVNFLHNSLNVADEVLDASNKAVALRKFLYAQAERNETAVVFVDEAQNLEPDVLRMLPKLACFDQLEDGTNVGLQFMLTGGSELREVLEDPDFEEVRGAIARNYDLRFFSRDELKYFLEKRLAPLTRLTPEPITDDAIEAVGKYTGGSPRLIGMICSHAMLFAAENPGRSIDEAMIEEAAEALMIEPAENAFAHENDDMVEQSGPFSSADLSGDEATNTPASEEDYVPQDNTPISASVDDSYDDDPLPDSEFQDFTNYNDAIDEPEIGSVMDDMSKGLDVDQIGDELDEDDFADEELTSKADAVKLGAAGAAGAVLGKMSSVFSRGGNKRGQLNHIVGAGRKGRNSGRAAEAPTEKRSMKTRVAGRREKQMKYGVYAAAFSGLVFGVWMIRADVTKVLASAADSVTSVTSSAPDTTGSASFEPNQIAVSEADQPFRIDTPSVDPSSFEPARTEPAPVEPSVEIAALDVNPPSMDTTSVAAIPPAPINTTPAKTKNGWGAQVEVLQPLPKPDRTTSESDFKLPGADGVKLPESGVGLVRGGLDLIESALEKSKDVLPEDMGSAIDVAKSDVEGLRRSAATNGTSGEAREARIAKLVAEGDNYFERGLYIAPARGCAYDSYRAALDIDPKNDKALRGIEDLRAFYSQKAEAARSKKQWDRANRFFETALGISQRKPVR